METLTNNTVSDAVVEKIRKLLALASELNDSKEQAEAAMKKAKALAVQHEVDLACIQVFENKASEQPIEREDICLGKRASVCQKFVSWILQHHFNVRIIYTGGRIGGKEMVLIGKRSDIEIACYVQGFLNQEFMRLWQKYHKTYQASQVKDRNSYFWGLYSGLTDKLKEAEAAAEKDAFEAMAPKAPSVETPAQSDEQNPADPTPAPVTHTAAEVEQVKACLQLARVTTKERIDDKIEELFPRLRTVRTYTRGAHNGLAREAGYSAGKNINLSRGIGSGNGGQLDN